ncbi:hypothetical protein R4J70_32145, partial [Pseudomonas aeruginosa]|uniref:hypothetical protein n=1 Tax=Pseudomonas aeruginosa TaxID=287 RepID=UPI0029550E52
KVQRDLASQCASMLNVALRPEMQLEQVGGKTLLVVYVPEADVHVWLVKDVPLLPFKAPARLVRLSLSGEDVGRARFPFAEH